MRSGRLRHSVHIERQSTTQDEFGQRVETWVEIAHKRAAIEPLNGKEYFADRGEQAEVETRIRIRYDSAISDLTPADRVNHDGIIYDIVSVINPNERGEEYVLMCKRNG
jgi:SPP1 family predicted phage head-tail adaptor